MGRWATFVAVRTNGETPPLLRDLEAELCTWPSASRGAHWQIFETTQTLLDDENTLARLLDETGSPVVVAEIVDSDFGCLVGLSRAGRWGTWLDPRAAYSFERDHHEMAGVPGAEAHRRARATLDGFGLSPADASRHAVGWAAEAGLVATARPIRQVLVGRRRKGWQQWLLLPSSRYDFVEDRFFDLLDRLGIPRDRP